MFSQILDPAKVKVAAPQLLLILGRHMQMMIIISKKRIIDFSYKKQ